MTNSKQFKLDRRKRRVRSKVAGTAAIPRLRVTRTLDNIYAQLIDDVAAKTILSASSLEQAFKGKTGSNVEAAQQVGELLASKAKAAKIAQVVFDRGGRIYHGRVKALAEGARKGGLKF